MNNTKTYKSLARQLSLSWIVDGKSKPIQFNPHADGHGELVTSDAEVQAYVEQHALFANGGIRIGKSWDVKKAEMIATLEDEIAERQEKIAALK